MSTVSPVSFGKAPKVAPKKNPDAPNVRTTKQGNPYYHTNTGKKVGTALGVVGTLVGAAITFAMTRNVKATAALLAIPAVESIASGLIGGAMIDAYVNHNEKKKADQMAAYNA